LLYKIPDTLDAVLLDGLSLPDIVALIWTSNGDILKVDETYTDAENEDDSKCG